MFNFISKLLNHCFPTTVYYLEWTEASDRSLVALDPITLAQKTYAASRSVDANGLVRFRVGFWKLREREDYRKSLRAPQSVETWISHP